VNIQITHVIVHTPEQVRDIVRDALAIADEQECDALERQMIFGHACTLLGQRYAFAAAPQQAPIDLGQLSAIGRRQ
jgi:hypothetical protein